MKTQIDALERTMTSDAGHQSDMLNNYAAYLLSM